MLFAIFVGACSSKDDAKIPGGTAPPPGPGTYKDQGIIKVKSPECMEGIAKFTNMEALMSLDCKGTWWWVATDPMADAIEAGGDLVFAAAGSKEEKETLAFLDGLDDYKDCIEAAVPNMAVSTEGFDLTVHASQSAEEINGTCLMGGGQCYLTDAANTGPWQLSAINIKDAWATVYGSATNILNHNVTVGVTDKHFGFDSSPMFLNQGNSQGQQACNTRTYEHLLIDRSFSQHGEQVLGSAFACADNVALYGAVDLDSRVIGAEFVSTASLVQAIRWLAGIDVCECEKKLIGTSSTDVCRREVWAVNQNPADVINTSINITGTGADTGIDASAVSLFLDIAQNIQGRSIWLASAGNTGKQSRHGSKLQFGALPSVIGVGASAPGLNRTDQRTQVKKAGFSSWGPSVDILAPGAKISVRLGNSPTQTQLIQGTSFASPIASAVVSLMKKVYPSMNWPKATFLIAKTASPVTLDNYCTSNAQNLSVNTAIVNSVINENRAIFSQPVIGALQQFIHSLPNGSFNQTTAQLVLDDLKPSLGSQQEGEDLQILWDIILDRATQQDEVQINLCRQLCQTPGTANQQNCTAGFIDAGRAVTAAKNAQQGTLASPPFRVPLLIASQYKIGRNKPVIELQNTGWVDGIVSLSSLSGAPIGAYNISRGPGHSQKIINNQFELGPDTGVVISLNLSKLGSANIIASIKPASEVGDNVDFVNTIEFILVNSL